MNSGRPPPTRDTDGDLIGRRFRLRYNDMLPPERRNCVKDGNPLMKAFCMNALWRVAIVAALLSLPSSAQAAESAYDRLDKGPKVGSALPHSLSAMDQNGRAQDFASLKGTRGLILLFSRSLNW
jgi:hypothetical protein